MGQNKNANVKVHIQTAQEAATFLNMIRHGRTVRKPLVEKVLRGTDADAMLSVTYLLTAEEALRAAQRFHAKWTRHDCFLALLALPKKTSYLAARSVLLSKIFRGPTKQWFGEKEYLDTWAAGVLLSVELEQLVEAVCATKARQFLETLSSLRKPNGEYLLSLSQRALVMVRLQRLQPRLALVVSREKEEAQPLVPPSLNYFDQTTKRGPDDVVH